MEQKIGGEGNLKVEVKDGKVVISVVYDGKGVDGALSLSADADYFIDQLAALIPGDSIVEQITLGALKMGIKSVKV